MHWFQMDTNQSGKSEGIMENGDNPVTMVAAYQCKHSKNMQFLRDHVELEMAILTSRQCENGC